MQASDVALVEEKLDLGTVYENHQKSRIQHCERSELRLHLSGQKLIKNDKNWSKMPKVKCDIFGNFQTLCLGSRIKVVSLLKRILEKKKDRRRQLRFSVVYPIKSYLISNATAHKLLLFSACFLEMKDLSSYFQVSRYLT